MNVAVGDVVEEGDVLARIDDSDALKSLISVQLQLAEAEDKLEQAKEALKDLSEAAEAADLLQAEADVVAAQESLDDLLAEPTAAQIAQAQAACDAAEEAYDLLVNGPTAADTEKAQLNLSKAKNSLWSSQMSRDSAGGRGTDNLQYDQAQASVLNAEISVRQAEMSLEELSEEPTDAELSAAQAKVLQAQEDLQDLVDGPTAAEIASSKAKLVNAQQTLDDMTAGPDDDDIADAEAAVAQAELSLQVAQMNLQAAEDDVTATNLVAPWSGFVTSVDASVGERVSAATGSGGQTVVSLADLSAMTLELYIDESDRDKLAVGYEIEAEFDAMPDTIFTGMVTQVDPSLVSVSNMDMLRAVASLDKDASPKLSLLPIGSNATVDVIGGRSENAVLVSVDALRDLGDGEYAVFMVKNGEPILTVVEIGLMDYTSAEVISGLNAGDIVSTGMVETR